MSKKTNKKVIYPLRISPRMARDIRAIRVSGDGTLSDAAVMRLAIERGLPIVQKILKPA